MSDHNKPKKAELLIDLSEQEQETLAAGCRCRGFMGGGESLFFQQTDIESFAGSDVNVPNGGGSASRKAGYKFSQTTLAFESFFFGRGRSRRSSFIGNLLSGLFGGFTG